MGITPLTQGDVSGDCVVYSALNAVRLLWPKAFRPLEVCEALYGDLIRQLGDQVVPMLIEGTDTDVGYRVGQHMVHLLKKRGLALAVEPLFADAAPDDIDTAMEALKARLEAAEAVRERSVAVIGLDEPWNHWTVATKVTRRSLKVFDSYQRCRLKRLKRDALSLALVNDKIVFDAPGTVIYRRLAGPAAE